MKVDIKSDLYSLIRKACLLLICLLLWSSTALSTNPDSKPNILFILTDDQSPYDLKIYNPASSLDTPVIDRLAKEGMVFDGAYHMGAFVSGVCTPSRHMIMSGRTVWHIPKSPEASVYVPPMLEEQTLAAVFNRAGYQTMRTCKRGNSYEAANMQFTIRKDKTQRDPDGSEWHADQVIDYLKERDSANVKDPFLIYLGFSHPHDPRNAKAALLLKYGADNEVVPVLPNPESPRLQSNYLSEHPFHFRIPNARDETRVQGVLDRRDEPTIRNELGRYFACIEEIDTQIGRVLRVLEEMGELHNTYVVFTSDHGIAIGRHGLQGKQNLYNHSWKVPFIVKGPGVKANEHKEGNIYLLDVLSTLCDLAGIEAPQTNEGVSFKPVLEGQKEIIRDVMYGVFSGDSKPGIRCVKKGDWKLIKYEVFESKILDGPKIKVSETQLFNLAENPDELLLEHHDPKVVALTGNAPGENQVNLAGLPQYADKLREMEALLLQEQERHNDPYRFSNQYHRK